MFASRILSRVSRSAGLRSSLSAAATLPARSQTSVYCRLESLVSIIHGLHKNLAAAQVPLGSFPLQRFSFSSSKTTGDKATADANESGLDS
ncbi:unnamed protein product [Brassica oleracea var. botrytis]